MAEGKLSKVETGLLAAKPKEVEDLIRLYRPLAVQADELRTLATTARRQSAPERVADTARQYVAFERAASEIRVVYGEVPTVPLRLVPFTSGGSTPFTLLCIERALTEDETRAALVRRIDELA